MLDAVIRGARYVSLIMVVTSFAGAVALTFVGAEKMFRAIWNYYTRTMPSNVVAAAKPSDVFIVRALESLDAFLIAFALVTFGFGILFLVIYPSRPEKERLPEILVPESITALKASLMQVVIVVLAIYFVRVAWLETEDLDFSLWALPGSILLLAAGMWVSNHSSQNKK